MSLHKAADCWSAVRLGALAAGLGLTIGGAIWCVRLLRNQSSGSSRAQHLKGIATSRTAATSTSEVAPNACPSPVEIFHESLAPAPELALEPTPKPAPEAVPEPSLHATGTAGAAARPNSLTTAGTDDCGSDNSSGSDSDDETPSPTGPMSDANYIRRFGLTQCVLVKVLGQGGFGRCELVDVPLPGGRAIQCVRKVLFHRADGVSRTDSLRQEIAGLRAVQGCDSAVQLLAWTDPQTINEPHELLLSYVPGVTLANHLEHLHEAQNIERFAALATRKARKDKKRKDKSGTPAAPKPPMPLAHVKLLARSLLTAIDYCHSNGNMAHLDIKTDNLMVDTSGGDDGIRFVLCDFGCAEACDDAGNIIRGRVGGSIRTAAPEQRRFLVGKKPEPGCGLSQAIDVASAGFLLSEVVAFWAAPMELNTFVYYEEYLPTWVPAGCADLIDKLTAYLPSDRLTAKQALAHWWLNE